MDLVATRRSTQTTLPHRWLADSARQLRWAAAIAVMTGGSILAVRMTGGTPNAFGHLSYVPIVAAGYVFGWRGALIVAVTVSLLLGPVGELTGMHTEGWQGWLIRTAAFLGIGLLVGVLFERMRSAVASAEANAATVRAREREAMLTFARGAEAKDEQTGQHVGRVQELSGRLALAVGLSDDDADRLGWSAMLHDVGKLHVPDSILLKPGPLDAEEWSIMRQHPVWGERILGDGKGFEVARRIARWHHEDFDGSGYPDGLSGEAIPLEARMVRVVDAFDAMTNDRPYSPALWVPDALAEIERCAGKQFDPELARLFIWLMERGAR